MSWLVPTTVRKAHVSIWPAFCPAFWPSRVTWSFIQHKASEEHRWSVTVQGKQHELWPFICLTVLTLLQMIQLSRPKSTIAVNQAMGYLKRSMFNLSVTCNKGYTHAWEYTSLSCSVVEMGLRQTWRKWAFRKSQSPHWKRRLHINGLASCYWLCMLSPLGEKLCALLFYWAAECNKDIFSAKHNYSLRVDTHH